ncbi:MAG: hypothetical protein HYY45_03915 [Deltaproteobacteria bacterium]|nr:hypothetical protein [Deltaproteobacteria bacterium]
MESIYNLGFINLAIPAWQMAIYIALVSFFMFVHETRGCLVTTYLFGLYWGYYLYGRDFLAAANGYPGVVTAYITFGLLLAGFSLLALFYEK